MMHHRDQLIGEKRKNRRQNQIPKIGIFVACSPSNARKERSAGSGRFDLVDRPDRAVLPRIRKLTAALPTSANKPPKQRLWAQIDLDWLIGIAVIGLLFCILAILLYFLALPMLSRKPLANKYSLPIVAARGNAPVKPVKKAKKNSTTIAGAVKRQPPSQKSEFKRTSAAVTMAKPKQRPIVPTVIRRPSPPATNSYGTRVNFVANPQIAFIQAADEKKLVFLMHISGNFEESRFT